MWVQMNNEEYRASPPPPYLGEFDAQKEWQDDSDRARKIFLHISAYNDFVQEHSLILLGRTGTGKTAILKCLQDDIETGICSLYDDVVNIDFYDLLSKIASFDDVVSKMNLANGLVETFEIIIHALVMKHLWEKHPQLKKIESYLTAQGMLRVKGARGIFHAFFTNAQVPGKASSYVETARSIYQFINTVNMVDYYEAVDEMRSFLSEKRFLVLIDSLDQYDVRNEHLIFVVKTLIGVCHKFHNNTSQNRIYVKIALPSEVHSRLIVELAGKHQSNTVTIQWGHKELICFIALRLFSWLEKQKLPEFDFYAAYNFHDFYYGQCQSYAKAREFLGHMFPYSCPTSLPYHFETLAYCIKHTLKKPRELMIIYNALLHRIIKSGNRRYYHEKPEKISKVIHSTQHEIINQALSMYATPYKNIANAFAHALEGADIILTGKQLKKRLKGIQKISEGDYDTEDFKKILFESGFIGKVNEEHIIPANTHHFKNAQDIHVFSAQFEYQLKGRLTYGNNISYVIHPLCYEYYHCWAYESYFIHPDRIDSDELLFTTVQMIPKI